MLGAALKSGCLFVCGGYALGDRSACGVPSSSSSTGDCRLKSSCTISRDHTEHMWPPSRLFEATGTQRQRYDSLFIGLGRFQIHAPRRPHRGPICGGGPQNPDRLQTPEMGIGLELVPFCKSMPMALPQIMETQRIVRTMTPLTGTVSGGTLSTERTMSYRKAQHEFECKDISRPSHGRDCGIEKDERSDGPLSYGACPKNETCAFSGRLTHHCTVAGGVRNENFSTGLHGKSLSRDVLG